MRYFMLAAVGLTIGMANEPKVAHAVLITGVTASTNMGSGFGTNLQNTVNGVGLSSLSLTASHAASVPTNSWVSSGGILTGLVTFNLNGLYSLEGFSFWNQNNGGPGPLGSTGIRDVQVSTSLNGVTFTSLAGGPTTFSRATTLVSLPAIFGFGPVDAAFVRFNILSNYGDTFQTGFAEAQFNGTAVVPEPSTFGMGLLGALGVGYAWRRRRATA